jgi:hypothetical protein
LHKNGDGSHASDGSRADLREAGSTVIERNALVSADLDLRSTA